ncbi:MAG: polyphenol oxidase family protein [Synergistaceae bacterium]|nr:polyphenol oxidase family protein [Synergistaceae bacterium]
MEFEGFNSYNKNGQFVIDLVLPDEIRDVFFASLYGRGWINDAAEGDPLKVWDFMSHNFNNVNLVAPHQVHGTDIIPAERRYSIPLRPEADGVFLNGSSDCFASLRFADCVPAVIAGITPEPWMLLLHSGFSGTVKNIISSGISAVIKHFDTNPAGRMWAWIGPCICKKCYSRRKEDPNTARAVESFSVSNTFESSGLVHFDIQNQIRDQLIESNIAKDSIYMYKSCTLCNRDIFYSYRGGDEKNRIFLLAGNATKCRK